MATRILAVLNQKGGVGKTTTCVNLGAALARRGQRVLLVDMDPQANLTVHLGLEPPRLPRTTYSLLLGQHGLAEAIHKTGVPGLSVVPSTLALANAEIQLASTVGRELVLREALEGWLNPEDEGEQMPFGARVPTGFARSGLGAATGRPGAAAPPNAAAPDAAAPDAAAPDAAAPDSGPESPPSSSVEGEDGASDDRPLADFVLIDCPPSLGTLTMNALCAAGEVLLPIQTEFFALQGVAGILESIKAVQRLNRELRLSLVVPSMVDRRTTLARDVIEEVRTYFPLLTTRTEIRKNVKLAEAPSHGQTIFEWDPRCNGAHDYDMLAAEVLGELPAESPDEAPKNKAPRDAGDGVAGNGGTEPRAATPETAAPETAAPETAAPETGRPASGISRPGEFAARADAQDLVPEEDRVPEEDHGAHAPASVTALDDEATVARVDAPTRLPEHEQPRFEAQAEVPPMDRGAQVEPTEAATTPAGTREPSDEPNQARKPERAAAPERPWWRSYKRS